MNTRRLAGRAVALAAVLLASGCLRAVDTYYSFEIDSHYINPGVFPGQYGEGASVLVPGPYEQSNATVVYLRSDRDAYAGVPESVTSEGYVQIPIAYWLPKNVSEPVPVIVDAGAYYEVGNHCLVNVPPGTPCPPEALVNDTIDWPGQTTQFSLANFLPHGYAVAQVAVRGTGTAGGCMDLMGPDEQADLSQAITWLGTQPWSNGKVAMIGASYDGSTPWEVAATGNPHLATIVPISGLPDIFDLMFHNGSAETRAAALHSSYWAYGFGDDFLTTVGIPGTPATPPASVRVPPSNPLIPSGQANGRQPYQDRQNLLCKEAWEGTLMVRYATYLGDRGGQFSTYWAERDYRDDVLRNFTGSVFLVHGLQDWNVDPHAAIPFNAQLRAAGVPMKEWYGQWGHALPQSSCAKDAPRWAWLPCRLDYGEVLFRWFEHYLKGNETASLGQPVHVQDDRGYWRMVDAYPPTDAEWLTLYPTPARGLASEPSRAASVTLLPPSPERAGPAQYLEFRSEPLEEDLRLSGLPRLPIEFEAQGPGGYIGAWLFDENETGHVLDRLVWTVPMGLPQPLSEFGVLPIIGHAQMDLRFHEGGDQPSELRPGERYVAKVEFEPLEVFLPKGHRVVLWLFQYQYPDRSGGPVPSPVKLYFGENTQLRLPTVDIDPRTVFPVPGSHFPSRDDFERFHVEKPVFSQVIEPMWDEQRASAACLDAWRAVAPGAAYGMYLRGDAPAACRA